MIVSERQAVSIHTRKGVQMYQYLPENTQAGSWGRVLRDTSQCSLTLPPSDHLDKLELTPWLHWASVWDIEATPPVLLWTGPIQQVTLNRTALQIQARDCSVFMSRTRVPMSKAWDATDPALIALELWQDMIDLHGLNVEPIVKLDPYGGKYDYTATADTKMMGDVIGDLVSLGLKWTVVAGIPILGPAPRNSIAALGAEHFLEDGLTLTRDGSSSYNDLLLLAGDSKSHARVPMAGLDLQQIVTADNVFGVSNAERAAYEAARYYASIRDTITLSGGSLLAPNAPLTIDQIIPSIRVNVEAFGQIYPMELTNATVTLGDGNSGTTVGVSMDTATDDLPELATINSQQANVSATGGVTGGVGT